MSKNNYMTWLQGCVLAFIVGFSGMACLVSGLGLPVSLWTVAFWCAVSSAVFSFCCSSRLGYVTLGGLVLVVGYLLYTGLLLKSAQSFLYFISTAYYDAFGWKVVHVGGMNLKTMEKALPAILCLWSSLTCAVTAWSIAKGQSTVPVVLMAIPAPFLCLLIPESAPGMLWLWLLIYGIVMALITGPTRFDEQKRGNRLTLFTALPVALAVIVLFAAVPKDAYTGQARAAKWSEVLLGETGLQDLWDNWMGNGSGTDYSKEVRKVSLTSLGERDLSDDTVLSVTANYTGTLYLRSSAYNKYDGKVWTHTGDGASLTWPGEGVLEEPIEVKISTEYAHSMLYLPYYVTSMRMDNVTRGIENEHRLTKYSITCAPMPDISFFEQMHPDNTNSQHVVAGQYAEQCTSLPEYTEKWAKPLAEQITKGLGNHYHKALAIADYVRNSAYYDLAPAQMPSGEQDFAHWFLENSDSGYCVHFATLTAVLLKAAGISSRYVTGYAVDCKANETVEVKEADAHAWVEYWLPGFGWVMLESTPAAMPQDQIPSHRGKTDTFSLNISLPDWLLFGVLIALPVGVVAQWQIRMGYKRRVMKKGQAKEQVISRYGYLEKLHGLLGEPVDEAVTALAEKAIFSPHPILDADVAVLDSAIDAAKGKLRGKNLWKQIYYRLVLAQL